MPKSKTDTCLLCGTAPCSCASTTKKASRQKKSEAVGAPLSPALPPALADDPDTIELAAAVNVLALAGMLPATELGRHARLIALARRTPPDLDKRKHKWKKRNKGERT